MRSRDGCAFLIVQNYTFLAVKGKVASYPTICICHLLIMLKSSQTHNFNPTDPATECILLSHRSSCTSSRSSISTGAASVLQVLVFPKLHIRLINVYVLGVLWVEEVYAGRGALHQQRNSQAQLPQYTP